MDEDDKRNKIAWGPDDGSIQDNGNDLTSDKQDKDDENGDDDEDRDERLAI